MEETYSLTSLDAAGRGVRVVFRRHGDRWVHALDALSEPRGVEFERSPLERFEEFLQGRGKRITQPRRKLVEFVFCREQSFDADELTTALSERPGRSAVSRPSIYRTLSELVDAGLLRKLEVGGRVVYDRGGWREAWQSAEGDAKEPWPASPALQSLHVSTLPDGREAILLVGMAGTSHWSASIETGTPGELIFDIACRMSKLPDETSRLGSAYKICPPDGDPLLHFECLPGVKDTEIQTTPNSRVIRPVCLPSRLPGTARWQYRITVG